MGRGSALSSRRRADGFGSLGASSPVTHRSLTPGGVGGVVYVPRMVSVSLLSHVTLFLPPSVITSPQAREL